MKPRTDLYADARSEAQPAPLPAPARALVVAAHPDDAEFGCGGTLARWSAGGTVVTLVVMTDGSKGSWDPTADPAALEVARRLEQQAAADVLGIDEVIFLSQPDGELEATLELRAEVCRLIRQFRPEVVLGHDPWQRYQLHPDHRASGWATADGVVAARDPLFFPDQLGGGIEAHRPAALLLWSADTPDHWEDISGYLDAKVAALLCHSSQTDTTMGGADRDDGSRAAFADRITGWAERTGALVGLQQAEAFKRIEP